MNHELLLHKYIKYVYGCEGTDFIEYGPRNSGIEVPFTEAEWAELKRLSHDDPRWVFDGHGTKIGFEGYEPTKEDK